MHRDSQELREIALPVYSIGTCPIGPRRLDRRGPATFEEARIGSVRVTREDYVFADDDGVLFLDRTRVDEVVRIATDIHVTERRQADSLRSGDSLRKQFEFARYLRERQTNPRLTLGEHLRSISAEIGE